MGDSNAIETDCDFLQWTYVNYHLPRRWSNKHNMLLLTVQSVDVITCSMLCYYNNNIQEVVLCMRCMLWSCMDSTKRYTCAVLKAQTNSSAAWGHIGGWHAEDDIFLIYSDFMLDDHQTMANMDCQWHLFSGYRAGWPQLVTLLLVEQWLCFPTGTF